MTWQELFELIPKDRLDESVSIYSLNDDEYYPMISYGFCTDGVLDDGNFYITF